MIVSSSNRRLPTAPGLSPNGARHDGPSVVGRHPTGLPSSVRPPHRVAQATRTDSTGSFGSPPFGAHNRNQSYGSNDRSSPEIPVTVTRNSSTRPTGAGAPSIPGYNSVSEESEAPSVHNGHEAYRQPADNQQHRSPGPSRDYSSMPPPELPDPEIHASASDPRPGQERFDSYSSLMPTPSPYTPAEATSSRQSVVIHAPEPLEY